MSRSPLPSTDVDGAALAPPGAWRDDLVDVGFVAFPVSPEEQVLRRRAMPFEGDTRIGSPAQVARYARWRYHPETRPGQPAGGGATTSTTSSASRSPTVERAVRVVEGSPGRWT